MRRVAQPALDLRPADAVSASIRGWLIALMAWFCDVVDALPASAWRFAIIRDAYAASKRRIAAGLRRDASVLRKIIFLYAHARFTFATGRARTFTRGVRPGLRAGRTAPPIWRTATAGIVTGMHQGALRDRVKRLRAMLENPERLIPRALKRLAAIWRVPHGRRLVLVAACDPCVSVASPMLHAAADTS